jgi:hypothetical protein
MARYKLTHYDVILDMENGGSIPMDIGNGDYQYYLYWLAEDPENHIPDPADPKFEDTWGYIRSLRMSMLMNCDWTQLPDSPLSVQAKLDWATYRQALRDVTENFASPADVVWPTPPS